MTRISKIALAAPFAAAMLFMGLPAMGEDAPVDKATFVKTVPSSNKFEIESSRLALERANAADVKTFAEQMIKDHTHAGEQFMAVIVKEGESAPSDQLLPKHAEMMKQLTAASGTDFDAAYVKLQHEAHVEAVSLFRSYSAKPDDPELGEFAKSTLPTLEKHLEHVTTLDAAH